MKLGGVKPMVVKSATKKKLMDLGIPQAVAIELANNRRWDDLASLTHQEMYDIIELYERNVSTLGSKLENTALWYGIMVHHQGTRHIQPWMSGKKWSWGKVTGGTLDKHHEQYMRKLVDKYKPFFEKLHQKHGRMFQIAINYTQYLNRIKCKGCQKLWKPENMDIYGETCPLCQAAYTGDNSYLDSIPSLGDLALEK